MKYALLVGYHYYPDAHLGDLFGKYGSKMEAAKAVLDGDPAGDWATIVDPDFDVVGNYSYTDDGWIEW